MSYQDIALPLAARGIPVIPVEPGSKRCLLEDWTSHATIDKEQILAWNRENPKYNVGCVAKPDGVVILDCDVKGLKKRIETECGQKIPATLIVRSGGKGAAHIYFLQNEWSRKLGNRKAPGLFDLQSNNKYVVGPGSVLDDGGTYKIVDDSPFAEFPEWLCHWIDRQTMPGKPVVKEGSLVDDDFDFDAFLTHYEIGGHQSGEWYVTDVCPVAGYKHEQSTRTGFFWNGSSLGFHCFAAGCGGSGMGIGDVLRLLNKTHGPYPGTIWEGETEQEALEAFNVDAVDAAVGFSTGDAEIQPIIESVPQSEEQQPESPGAKHKLVRIVRSEDTECEQQMVGVKASQITEKRLRWLWPDKIPAAKLVLWTGKPDNGKTLSLLDLTARITTGRDWPDGSPNVHGPRIVIYAATEDDPQDTLVPRLRAAGADLDKVVFPLYVESVDKVGKDGRSKSKLNLKAHISLLRKAIEKTPEVSALILDPMNSYWGDVDDNKGKEIRPVLESVAALCRETGLTVIGLIHHSKRSDTDALGKVLGSVSVGGIARCVWEISKDPEDNTVVRMALAKGNLSKKRSGMTYHIESVVLTIEDEETELPHVVWDAELDKSADQLLSEQKEKAKQGPADKRLEAARNLIRSSLPMTPPELFELARREGISTATLYRAKDELGIVSERLGGKSRKWWLPEQWQKHVAELEGQGLSDVIDTDVM